MKYLRVTYPKKITLFIEIQHLIGNLVLYLAFLSKLCFLICKWKIKLHRCFLTIFTMLSKNFVKQKSRSDFYNPLSSGLGLQ